jgi:apolipoprotein N-acyltransferase
MLDFIILSGLTVAAWKRGWKGWALIPIIAYMPLCFITGLFFGSIGMSMNEIDSISGVAAIVILVAICVALIVMIITGRKHHNAMTMITPRSNTQNYITLK